MTLPLFIMGIRGVGRDLFGIIGTLKRTPNTLRVAGFIDDTPSPTDLENLDALGCGITGSVDDVARRTKPFASVVAIGSAVDRETDVNLLVNCPVNFPVLVHLDATIGCNVHFAEGVVVAAGSRLSTNIREGRRVQVDQNATFGHDCNLGDFSRLNPQARASGRVTISRPSDDRCGCHCFTRTEGRRRRRSGGRCRSDPLGPVGYHRCELTRAMTTASSPTPKEDDFR